MRHEYSHSQKKQLRIMYGLLQAETRVSVMQMMLIIILKVEQIQCYLETNFGNMLAADKMFVLWLMGELSARNSSRP